VTISDHRVKATLEGTAVSDVMALVQIPSGEKLRGGELLADKRDGKPLSASEGPSCRGCPLATTLIEARKRKQL